MKKNLTIAGLSLVVIVAFIIFLSMRVLLPADESGVYNSVFSDVFDDSEENCNILGIQIHGELVTYTGQLSFLDEEEAPVDQTSADDVVGLIGLASFSNDIKGILVEIDSIGGSPIASEEITDELILAEKPTAAFIRDAAYSGAYWIATGADRIFASKLSDIGSIGVTMSYLENTAANAMEGIRYIELNSAPFKDMLDPNKPLTVEERKLIKRDLDIMHEIFVEAVAENRGLEIEKVRALADGSTMLGEMALKNGLIDVIGGYNEAVKYLETQIGEPVSVCWH
jgi:signal peptide peptidase SppA